MHLACSIGSIECVELLLAARADVGKATKEHGTPLAFAFTTRSASKDDDDFTHRSHSGFAKCVDRLLAKRADPNDIGHGWNILHYGIIEQNAEAVRVLLAAKANVDLTAPDGDSPLLRACRKGFVECVDQLLNARAAVHEDSLICSCVHGNHECVARLLQFGARDDASSHGITPMLVCIGASGSPSEKCVLELLAHTDRAARLYNRVVSTYAFPPPVDLDAYAAACRLPPAEETEDEREARFQRERCFGL